MTGQELLEEYKKRRQGNNVSSDKLTSSSKPASTSYTGSQLLDKFYGRNSISEDDNKFGWLDPEADVNAETAAGRKERYTSNQNRISEIEGQLKSVAGSWVPNFIENWFLSDEEEALRDEMEGLKAENLQYERTQGALDKYYTPETPEFLANGAFRDYTNASRDDLRTINANEDYINDLLTSYGMFDGQGNIVNATTGEIVYRADDLSRAMYKNATEGGGGGLLDKWTGNTAPNYVDEYYKSLVQDKLGMFLSSSEDERVEAVSELAAGAGDNNNTWAEVIRDGDALGWEQLTEYEINLYYDILKREGQAAAYGYLDAMTTVLTRRATEERAKEIADATVLEQIALNIASVPMSTVGGAIGLLEDVGNTLSGKDINPYSAAHSMSNDASAIRQDTASDIDKATGNAALPWVGTTFGDVYQSVMSFADSALASYIPGGSALLGMNAATSTIRDLYDRGASQGQMLAGGILAGTAEAAFEHFSIGQLKQLRDMDTKAVKNLADWFVRTTIMGGVEASEEMATEIANTISDALVMGSQTNWEDFETFVKNVVNAGIGGFISGGFGGGIAAGINNAQYNSQAKAHGQAIIDNGGVDPLKALALEMSGESQNKQGKQISRLASKVGNKATPKNVGKLSDFMENTITSTNEATLAKALAEKGLTKLGATKVAKYILDSNELSKQEIAKIEGDERIQKVMDEVLADSNLDISDASIRLQGARQGIKASSASEVATGLAEKASVAKSEAEALSATEAKFKASETGKTIYKDAQGIVRDAEIKRIASTEGGIKVELESGETVKASDISFGTPEEAVMYEMVARMEASPETANEIISTFKPSNVGEATRFLTTIPLAYTYGKMGYEAGLKNVAIPGELAKIVYNRGRMDAMLQDKSSQAKIVSTVTKNAENNSKSASKVKNSKASVSKSGIIFENGYVYDESKANDLQKASMVGIETISKMSNLEVHVYESWVDEKGNRVYSNKGKIEPAPNGYYIEGGNKIYIDINAGNGGEGAMLYTASHEVGHYIREWNAKGFRELGDFLIKEYGKQGVPVNALLEAQKEKIRDRYKRNNETMPSEAKLNDMAYEELVCDAMSDMLTDPMAYEKLAKLKAQNKTLWQKLGEAIKALLDKIKTVLGVYKEKDAPVAQEAHFVRGFSKEAYDKLQDLYIKAFVEADENYGELAESGIIVDSKSESATLMSVRDVLSDEDRKKVAKALAERFGVTQTEAMDWLKAETSLASLILNPKYSQYLDYTADPNEEAIKSNSDYPQGTVDFSNICKKRRDFTEVMNRVLRNFPNHVFAATDLAKIRTIMEEEGMEVACAICYVEDRRQLDSVVAQDFIDSLAIYREGGKVRPDGKPFNANQLKAFELIEGDTYTPSIYELISLEGRNALKAKNPAMEQAWVKFNNARGMQSVRLLLNDAEYKRQILKYSPSVVKRKNDLGGLRIYSFSDAEMFHLIDIIQVITDSATVGLSLQGYTKVNEYAKAVKDTGEKLNRSLIPKGDLGYHMEGGRVVLDFDTTEGIDINHPDFFDNIDNPNIGNIVIGINATQIKAAMTSKFIDQIIPFHTGQSGEVLGEKGIAAWENYKDSQSERDVKTGKKSSHQINIYTEVINAAEAEGKPITNKVDFVNKFLEVCKKNNLIPRFSEFLNVNENGEYVYTEGYHKLLVDFKTFAQTEVGEYLPQMPVKPIFDNEYITGLLTDYVKSQKAKDAETAKSMPKVLDRITKEIVKPGETKYSERDTTYLDAVNRGDMETAQRMVDEAAKEAGYTVKAYHGTPNMEFTVFDKSRVGKGNDQYGAGFYFATDKEAASHYGNRVINAVLSINKPIKMTANTDVNNLIQAEILLTSKQAYEVVKRLPDIYDAEESPLGDYFDTYWEDGAQDWMIRELAEQYRDVGLLDSDLFRNYPNELHEALRDVVGYDGVEVTFEKTREKFYVAWFDNQMKSADPVTYDDNGNVIPLSERFNTGNSDIRYSDRDSLGNELSEEQAEFFKDSKVRDKKGNLMVLYHGTTANFNTFKKGDVGFHFGTKGAARGRVGFGKNVTLKEVYLNITNPIVFDEDLGSWDADYRLTEELYDRGILTQAEEETVLLSDDKSYRRTTEAANKKLASLLVAKGYDGIAYSNTFETKKATTSYIVFNSNQAKEITNKAPTASADIRYSERDSYAPVFYSHMGRVIDEIKLEKMGASSILNHLKNRGVKDEEIKWSGIEAWLEGKKSVTKAELQEFVAGSQLQIKEQMSDDEEYTHWSEYKLEGGSNYREIAFQMPGSDYSNSAMRTHWGQDAEGVLAHARIQDFIVKGQKMLFVEEIQSDWHNEGHTEGYGDPKKAADLKLKALALDDKNKTERRSLIEILAKHLEGKVDTPEAAAKSFLDFAYVNDNLYVKYIQKYDIPIDLVVRMNKLRKSRDEANSLHSQSYDLERGIPDAPFRTTYHEYVLKRLLRMAAEEGYDSIGWTTADIQSQRWSDEYAEGYRIEYDQDIPKFLRKYGKKWGATVGKTKLPSLNPSETYYDVNRQEEYDSFPVWQDMVRDELEAQGADVRKVLFTIEDDRYWIAYDKVSGIEYDRAEIRKTSGDVWSMSIPDSMKESVLYEGQVLYSERVTDKKTLDFLENQEHVTVYRAMQVIDGELYPPMAAKVKSDDGKKKLVTPSKIGAWEQAVERPDLIRNGNKFELDKANGSSIQAAYNPYFHTSASPLNDQFSSAYKRPNLVIVEGEIPASELTSGYRAEFAKDTVGETRWHSGPVASKLKGDKARRVFLSRWFKPVRIVPDSEVASIVAKTLEGENIDVPYNVVTPTLRAELEKAGVPIKYQERESTSVSNRSLLANALEGVAQNDIERQKLGQYKAKIAQVEAEQKRLSEIRAEANKLRFTKGRTAEETKKMRSLDDEATKIANRITTYDKQLLGLESTKALKGVLEREKANLKKRLEAEGRKALSEQRQKNAEAVKGIVSHYQESRKKAIEGRSRTAMRHKIQSVVKELNEYLLNGTKEKHVPIGLQKAVAEALDAVNMDTVGAEERIAKKRDEMMKAKSPEVIERLAKEIDTIQEMGGNMARKLSHLKTAYDSIIDSEDPLVAGSHDEVISNTIERVMATVGDTALRDMSLGQLESVYDMYRMVLHSIRAANKAFKAKKSEAISEIAGKVMLEIGNLGKKKPLQTKVGQGVSSFDWNNQKPVYAFARIGSDTFTDLFNNVRAGEDTWAVDMTEAQAFREEQYKKHNHDAWDFKKTFKFTSASGMDFELTLDQIMSLYAYSKRDQAAEHLKRGGIVFDETTKVTVKNKLGIPVEFNPTEATAYNISEMTLAEIVSKLTAEQKAFVDEMQDYLSTVMGEKGNEVSLELYGVKLFKEKNYFPLKSATQFMAKAKEQQKGEVKIKNSGFTKETVRNANNPIVLTPFMDVWAGHVNEMSMYHAFTLALEDFYRVYNYKTPTSETAATESVEMFLQNAHGKAATMYIDQLLRDLNGGARVDSTAGIINKLTGLFKKSAVFASLSVVVQQPSSIARATALVDTKYFVGKPSKHKETWAEVKKYAPVAIIKEMGYFDTGMGKSSAEWLKGEKTWKDKVDDIASKAPALADEYTWCAIWNAVKRETTHNNPSLDPTSDEFLKLVGERFTEVVTKTQVYDSVLARSANMRSKDTGMKMATAFMGEPTTSLNMLQDALIQGKRGNKKYAVKAIGGVISSMILNAILVSLVYAGRDDDEEKTYAEKYVNTLTEELLDSFNPLTLIPFVKDLVSIAQGYDVERSDMAVATDLINAWNNLDNDNRSAYRKVEDFGGAIAAIFGLPVKNVMRDVRGMYNTVNSFINGEKTTGAGIGNAIEEAVTGTEKSNGQKLYEAMVKGDSAQIKRIEGGFESQSAINSAIRKALRENDSRIHEAAQARYDGDITEYTRIVRKIVSEGHFKQDDVVAAVNAEINAIKKGETSVKEETETKEEVTSIYSASDINVAFESRDNNMALEIIRDLIETKVANGKTEKEAKSSLRSSMTAYYKPLYKQAYSEDDSAEMLRIRKILLASGLYGSSSDVVATVRSWLKN